MGYHKRGSRGVGGTSLGGLTWVGEYNYLIKLAHAQTFGKKTRISPQIAHEITNS